MSDLGTPTKVPRWWRSRTGCLGVSYSEMRVCGGKLFRRYFSAYAGGKNRKFCINTLGKEEAWRRALKYRAQYELKLRAEIARGGEMEVEK